MSIVRQINYWTIGGFEGAKPIAQALREAKELGYEGIELCFGAGELSPGVTEAKCREIRAEAERLKVHAMKLHALVNAPSGAWLGSGVSRPASRASFTTGIAWLVV